jgi:hypothetical protein
MKALAARDREQLVRLRAAAYWTAMLVRAKEMPSYDSFVAIRRKAEVQMTDTQLRAVVEMLAAAGLGTITRPGEQVHG